MTDWLARARALVPVRAEAANDDALRPTTPEQEVGARYRWLIIEPNGQRKEICALPEMTRDELARCYPGARLVPLPDSPSEAEQWMANSSSAPGSRCQNAQPRCA